jgi:hypothetical protein
MTRKVCDQNSDSNVLSSLVGQPLYDTSSSSYRVSPLSIDTKIIEFYVYAELYGDPFGRGMWTSKLSLNMGCDNAITLTDSSSFVSMLGLHISEATSYTFFEPTVDHRATYCA